MGSRPSWLRGWPHATRRDELTAYYVHVNRATTGEGRDASPPGVGVVTRPGLRMASISPHASDLIRDIAQGQLTALEQFYDRHIQLVYNGRPAARPPPADQS